MGARNKARSRHHDHMPFAKQPLKAIYVSQRLLTTLLLVPMWMLYYTLLPRKSRPRESWSLKQIVTVNFYRRVFKVTELAGVKWCTRDPDEECPDHKLKETRFEWIDPLPECLCSGIVVDKQVPFKRVGVFVWPKDSTSEDRHGSKLAFANETDVEAIGDDPPVIGIFLHGGGYCHMSAHEHAGTSRIPRRLMEDKAFDKIYAVEYRLLQHAPFPAAVQDAAAVYAYIVHQHKRSSNGDSTSNASDTLDTPKDNGDAQPDVSQVTDFLNVSYTAEMAKNEKDNKEVKASVAAAVRETHCKIVLIGDSAGGNLVLALARWIRDEGVLPPPAGLMLLSPSCDPSHAFPETPSAYIPRPHADTDYLVDTPEPRALLQRMFLGHNPLETMHSPYVSPASCHVLRAFYGDAFAENVADLTIACLDTALLQTLRTMACVPGTPAEDLESSSTSPAPPVIASPRGLSLFSEFPRVCVVLGDAERLEREVIKLVGAMECDGVDVSTVWVEDGVHDVLQLAWWDERVRNKVWVAVGEWLRDL